MCWPKWTNGRWGWKTERCVSWASPCALGSYRKNDIADTSSQNEFSSQSLGSGMKALFETRWRAWGSQLSLLLLDYFKQVQLGGGSEETVNTPDGFYIPSDLGTSKDSPTGGHLDYLDPDPCKQQFSSDTLAVGCLFAWLYPKRKVLILFEVERWISTWINCQSFSTACRLFLDLPEQIHFKVEMKIH